MTPTQEARRTRTAAGHKPPQGLDAVVNGWVGRWQRRAGVAQDFYAGAARVIAQGARLAELSDEALDLCVPEEQSAARRGASGDRALALIAEMARRVLGMQPYPVQIMAALAVQRGFLAEMATGEGKTLVIGLAGALAAWSGQPLHVLTANDYLAARDAAWLRDFYRRCGLTVGCVTSEMPSGERRANYAADIVYSTPKEVCADFLRDRLKLGPLTEPARRLLRAARDLHAGDELVMRGLHRAIVDEADNALIDEAVTPLIISRKVENPALHSACRTACQIARELRRGIDYTVDSVFQEISFRASAIAHIEEQATQLPGLWRAGHRKVELVRQALVAREFFHRDQQYIVQEGAVVIVDEFTGRLMPQRTWRQGLHEAIEVAEGLDAGGSTETLARLSFQRFFRLYGRLSGLSGTAAEAAGELWQSYALPVICIPLHRPSRRRSQPARCFADQEAKWRVVVAEIERVHALGRPILVGTRTVRASEALAARLAERGLGCQVLNAARHREEAQIIATAGHAGRVTIATNMAGRGTDIALGPGVAELGGLHVIATEWHEAARIDRQLFGRCGRQGDPGSVQAFASLEDALPVRYAPASLCRLAAAGLRAALPGAEASALALLSLAQRTAQKQAARQRRQMLEIDSWLDDSLSFVGRAI